MVVLFKGMGRQMEEQGLKKGRTFKDIYHLGK